MGNPYEPHRSRSVSDRLTLATSTGLPFLALAFHAVMGTVALVSGCIAIAAHKGGAWHRRSGLFFVGAMIAMGLTGVGISVYERKPSVAAGAVAAYLVFTAWTAIRPVPVWGRGVDIALTLLACVFAAGGFRDAFTTFGMPGHKNEGVPAGMQFFLATILSLAAIGDIRLLRAGALKGTRRLARHLWRMCFGLFIATGSFVTQLVRMRFMPDWMRSLTVILVFAVGPLVVLLYWMWRIRVRQNLRGLMTMKPIEARG